MRINTQSMKMTAIACLVLPASLATAEQGKLWKGDVEFGYVSTSGNTDETNIKARADIKREWSDWRYQIVLDSLNSESNNQSTAEKYFLSNRLAYQFNEHDYIFGYASYDDDRFSGFDYQAIAAVGYGRRLLNNPEMQWDVEIGPGYRYSKFNDGAPESSNSEAILRLATNYNWDVSETTNFQQTLSIETGEDNTITKSLSALKLQIIGALAMKLSYAIKHTDEVPAGIDSTDTETSVTVTYSF